MPLLPGATVRTPAGDGVVVWASLDRVRVAFAPDNAKTYLASAADAWTVVSDGTSDSPRDRFGRLVARLRREGVAQCDACGALLTDAISRAVGRGPECRSGAMAKRGTPEERLAAYLDPEADSYNVTSDEQLALLLIELGWAGAQR